jgi:hypothetical protein
MAKLAALNAQQLIAVLLALGAAAALVVWGLVWVMWTIRPLLAAPASLAAVAGALYALRRHRLSADWHSQEWLGS